MTDKQLLEQALAEAKRANEIALREFGIGLIDLNVITAIRTRLEQPEQGPVASGSVGHPAYTPQDHWEAWANKPPAAPYVASPRVQEPVAHWSDCAVHSEPAYPAGKCDCGGYIPKVHTHQELYKAAKDFYNLTVAEPALRLTSKNRSVRDAAQAAGERLRALITIPPAAQPAVPLEPVAWVGWHTSTDEMMLFKTKAEAVSWRDQYKKDFASIEGLVRPFLPAAPVQDAEGENKAVRCFLMLYGQAGLTVGQMKKHMAMGGFKSWPAWVENEHDGSHLTKAGAQLWIRHLFSLEATAPVQEPVAWLQVYRCKIKSKPQINKEIPREKQGWWADVSAGELIRLRQATQADIDRCTLNGAHSKDPADYMCETFKNGALVSKIALEYMNPEQNVFAAVYTTPPAAQPAPVQEEIDTAYRQGYEAGVAGQQHYIDALKAKLKEKNNG